MARILGEQGVEFTGLKYPRNFLAMSEGLQDGICTTGIPHIDYATQLLVFCHLSLVIVHKALKLDLSILVYGQFYSVWTEYISK